MEATPNIKQPACTDCRLWQINDIGANYRVLGSINPSLRIMAVVRDLPILKSESKEEGVQASGVKNICT